MRYYVRGNEVRSENAAKPHTLAARSVVAYLRRLKNRPTILDYGCGKLRYGAAIYKASSKSIFVDSEVQLRRIQTVRGRRTTVENFVLKHMRRARTVSIESLHNHRKRYDVVTCLNVLSAIASPKVLTQALSSILKLTKLRGFAVFVNQHRNSYFKRYSVGQPHMYGHLYFNSKGTSYYGILEKEVVARLLMRNNFEVIRSWSDGELNFVEARPLRKPQSRKRFNAENFEYVK